MLARCGLGALTMLVLVVPNVSNARIGWSAEVFSRLQSSDNSFQEPADDSRVILFRRLGRASGLSKPRGVVDEVEWSNGLAVNFSGGFDKIQAYGDYRFEVNTNLNDQQADGQLLTGDSNLSYFIRPGRLRWEAFHSARRSNVDALEDIHFGKRDFRNTFGTGPVYRLKLARNSLATLSGFYTHSFHNGNKDLDGGRIYLKSNWKRLLSETLSIEADASYLDAHFESDQVPGYSNAHLSGIVRLKRRWFDVAIRGGVNHIASDKEAQVPVYEINRLTLQTVARLVSTGKKQSRTASVLGVEFTGDLFGSPYLFALSRELTDSSSGSQEPFLKYQFASVQDVRLIERSLVVFEISRAYLQDRLNFKLATFVNDEQGVDTPLGDQRISRVLGTAEYRLTDAWRVNMRVEQRNAVSKRNPVTDSSVLLPGVALDLSVTPERDDQLVRYSLGFGYQFSPRTTFSARAGVVNNESNLPQYVYDETFVTTELKYRFDER